MKFVGQVIGIISAGSLQLRKMLLASISYALGHHTDMIASNHRAIYVAQTAAFRDIPNSESLSYVMDVHANPGRQTVIAQIPSRRPLDGGIPALARCAMQQQSVAREH